MADAAPKPADQKVNRIPPRARLLLEDVRHALCTEVNSADRAELIKLIDTVLPDGPFDRTEFVREHKLEG